MSFSYKILAVENQTEKLTNILLSFDLSKKEAAVYLAILSLGRGTVSQISRKANINRTTGYDILAHLVAKGLVSVSGKEPKQEYIAESPDSLIKLLDARLKRTEDDIETAQAYIPELKSIHKVGDRPQVKFYEGKEGLKHVYEDTLTATEHIRVYGSYEDAHQALQSYFPSYYKRRADNGIWVRGIAPKTDLTMERLKHTSKEKRELALVPPNTFTPHPEIDIYDNKVMIASWREKLGIIIESAEIADAMKKIFELAWIGAKTLDKGSESRV